MVKKGSLNLIFLLFFFCFHSAEAQRYTPIPDYGSGPVYLQPDNHNLMVAFRDLARGKARIQIMERYDLLFDAQLTPFFLQHMLRFLNTHHEASKQIIAHDRTFSFFLERTSYKTIRLTVEENLNRRTVELNLDAKSTSTLFNVLRYVRM